MVKNLPNSREYGPLQSMSIFPLVFFKAKMLRTTLQVTVEVILPPPYVKAREGINRSKTVQMLNPSDPGGECYR